MNLMTIAWKSLRQRRLASFLTALSVALGVALMVAVLVINGVITEMFTQSGTRWRECRSSSTRSTGAGVGR